VERNDTHHSVVERDGFREALNSTHPTIRPTGREKRGKPHGDFMS